MNPFERRPLAWAVAAACASIGSYTAVALLAPSQACAQTLAPRSLAMHLERGGPGTHTLALVFEEETPWPDGQFAVYVDREDVTVQFRRRDARSWVGDFSHAALSASARLIKVLAKNAQGRWEIVAQLALQANDTNPDSLDAPATPLPPNPDAGAPAGGSTVAPVPAVASVAPVQPAAPQATTGKPAKPFTPSLVLGFKGQLAESHSAAATQPTRPTYADGTLQAGLATEHGGKDWTLKSSTQLVGSSYQNEALQFGLRGADAPKVDLARYLIEGQWRGDAKQRTSLALGHVQAGTNTLLATNVANRGLVFRHQPNEKMELTIATQSSTAQVGTRHLSGLEDTGNRFDQTTLAYEWLPRAGALRTEASVFGGRTQTPPALGSSSPPEVQNSRGWGLRVVGATENNRWHGELFLAQSANANAASGGLRSPRRTAYSLELGHELYQGEVLWPSQPDWPLTLGITLHSERAAPAYFSLGAATQADVLSHKLSLNASLGAVSAELAANTHQDNLGWSAAQPRLSAPALTAALRLPLAELFKPKAASAAPEAAAAPSETGAGAKADEAAQGSADLAAAQAEQAAAPGQGEPAPASKWWPELSYALELRRDKADPNWVPTGGTAAELPNSLATTHRLGLTWTLETGSLGYAYSRVLQDKRELAHAAEDVLDTGHDLTATWNPSKTLALNAGLGWHTGTAYLTGVDTRSLTGSLGLQWTLADQFVMALKANAADTRDEPRSALARALGGEWGLTRTHKWTQWGMPMKSQWGLRYVFSRASVASTSGSTAGPVRNEALTATASFSF